MGDEADYLEEFYIEDYFEDEDSDEYVQACKSINELPPVQPIRPRNRWIIDYEESSLDGCNRIFACHCSNCNHDPLENIGEVDDYWLTNILKVCPNCGTYMSEAKR